MTNKSNSKEEDLFHRYVEICNRALELNKDRFPFKQILHTAQNMMDNETVSLAVYDDNPKATYDISINENQIDVIDKNKTDKSNDVWHINLSYLEKVVGNPEEYIKNPAKIDWDWLKNRLHM